MLTQIADALTILAVISGLTSAVFWWRSAHLQTKRSIGWNKVIRELDAKVIRLNMWAAGLTGLSVGLQAIATAVARFAPHAAGT
jgi:hypothetical protein